MKAPSIAGGASDASAFAATIGEHRRPMHDTIATDEKHAIAEQAPGIITTTTKELP